MIDQTLAERAWEISKGYRKITAPLLVRKLKINFDTANVICQKIWLRRNREAREDARLFLESMGGI